VTYGKSFDQRVDAVRRFNRFYTKQIGVLQKGLLKSSFSLTEARILYELANRENPTASDLGKDLGLDPGYLSRIIQAFEKRGLVDKKRAGQDRRQRLLQITDKGKEAYAPLNARSRAEIGTMLGELPEHDQERLMEAIHTVETLLGARPEARTPYLLRPHQPGDMGKIVQLHGALYAQEYGWNDDFEVLVARVAADFLENFDSKCERCWVAEKDGEVVGSVLLVKKSDTVAKLRLLIVDPKARGLGIGKRLVSECERFAKQVGYRKITLWTNANLRAATHIYGSTGYVLVGEEPHHSFGKDLIGQTWEKEL